MVHKWFPRVPLIAGRHRHEDRRGNFPGGDGFSCCAVRFQASLPVGFGFLPEQLGRGYDDRFCKRPALVSFDRISGLGKPGEHFAFTRRQAALRLEARDDSLLFWRKHTSRCDPGALRSRQTGSVVFRIRTIRQRGVQLLYGAAAGGRHGCDLVKACAASLCEGFAARHLLDGGGPIGVCVG